jgi:signal transduction histidine kinase
VRIAFRDTGRGISRDQLRRLFDPFHSTKESGQHMGLGLFVSLEIVRQHGGTIVADSELGSGSTFTVVLPTER